MKQILCLSIAAVLLFGAAVVHGQPDAGVLSAIDCSSVTAIAFTIAIPDIDQWTTGNAADETAWDLNDVAACTPTAFNQGDGNVEYTIDGSVCDVTPRIEFDKVYYEFEINVVSDDTPVTYQYDHIYTVTCTYDAQQNNLMASFEPRHSLTDDGSSGGTLDIVLTLHFSSGDAAITPGPSGDIVDLTTGIYGKAVVEADGYPALDVHFVSVTASPANDVNHANAIEIVNAGCETANAVVDSVDCTTNAVDRFVMVNNGAFRFQGQTTGQQVYFFATVTVCLSSDDASGFCQAQCAACPAKRKRRETVQDALQTTYYVSAGPYRIADPNKEAAVDKNVKDEGSAFPTYAIAVVAVCGVVAIAIASAVVVIVLRRRRQNTTISEPRDTGVTA